MEYFISRSSCYSFHITLMDVLLGYQKSQTENHCEQNRFNFCDCYFFSHPRLYYTIQFCHIVFISTWLTDNLCYLLFIWCFYIYCLVNTLNVLILFIDAQCSMVIFNKCGVDYLSIWHFTNSIELYSSHLNQMFIQKKKR